MNDPQSDGAAESTPDWMTAVLKAAAIYNWVWGAWVILFPAAIFSLSGIQPPPYPSIWQCVGMMVAVFGFGYWIAASDPMRHWPIVAVGLLGKVLGPIGFAAAAIRGELPWAWGITILANDLVWWLPFGMILFYSFRRANDPQLRLIGAGESAVSDWTFDQANAMPLVEGGRSLADLSREQPVLLIFIRHAGCTFCRETLSDLQAVRPQLSRAGVLPVVVHMGSVDQGRSMLDRYSLGDCPQISDPDSRLFRAYQLSRGGFWELLGPTVWWRGFVAAIIHRHGVGKLVGDGFQMPGTFLLHHGRLIKSHRHRSPAERIDYESFACQR